ncbi:MAG: YceI family protein [Candidatus Dormiibacterota bacterium]
MTTFTVLSGSSTLETEVRSSVHPIHARSTELEGRIEGEFDGEGVPDLTSPHGGRIQVPVDSIASGSRLNDMEMQRRAEVSKYPRIEFEVGDVTSSGNDGRYRGTIKVKAHGTTRSVEEEFTLRLDGKRLTLEGEHTFDMRDFGVQPPRIFTLKVEPEVRVKVRVVAEEA